MTKANSEEKNRKAPPRTPAPKETPRQMPKREIKCGFCQNTVIFEGVKKGQKIACPNCNFTLEIK